MKVDSDSASFILIITSIVSVLHTTLDILQGICMSYRDMDRENLSYNLIRPRVI